MWELIQRDSGQIYSLRTFRRFWFFTWTSTIYRQYPVRACIAKVEYTNRAAAEEGHRELKKLLRARKLDAAMSDALESIVAFAKERAGQGVVAHQIFRDKSE